MSDDGIIDLDAERSEPRTAFVMAGGATRGASQVGMLQALTEHGVRADLVVGTSIGALNGACYAESPTLDALDRLAGLWEAPPRAHIFSLSARSIAHNVRTRKGYVLDNHGLRDWIRTNTSIVRMEDFQIPLHAVATDARTREPVVLSHGDTVEVLLASSAIPGVFPPVTVAGTTLIDGGASADIPVAPALALGATKLFVLPTLPHGAEPPGRLWQLLDRLFGQPAAAADLATPPEVEIHWLPAPQPDGNPVSFRASARLIDESRALTHAYLADHDIGVDPGAGVSAQAGPAVLDLRTSTSPGRRASTCPAR